MQVTNVLPAASVVHADEDLAQRSRDPDMDVLLQIDAGVVCENLNREFCHFQDNYE
jgi:hypothetical protein